MQIFYSLVLLLVLFSSSQAAHLSASYRELDSFADHEFKRFNEDARLSGDGSKIVYVETSSGFDLSLSGWLAARDTAWEADAAAKVYLYDIATDTHNAIYQGQFASATVDGSMVLQSLESSFSVDINYDGSLVVLAYHSTAFNGARDAISNQLHLLAINTETQKTAEIANFTVAGFSPDAVPLKLSADNSTVVFAYEPAADTSTSTWSIDYLESSKRQELIAISLTADTLSPVRLNQDKAADGSDIKLVSFIDPQHHKFFDLSADGSRVVYQAVGDGKIIGVNSDGSNAHEIAQMTAGAGNYVALSGDGEVVVYAERGDGGDSLLYKNSFAGGQTQALLEETLTAPGNFLLNQDGSLLLLNTYVAGPGGTYGFSLTSYYLHTDGQGKLFEVNKDLYDVSADFSRALTGFYYSPRLQLSHLNPAPQVYMDTEMQVLVFEIPLLDVSGQLFSATLLWMGFAENNPDNLLFQAVAVEELGTHSEQGLPSLDMDTFRINLPHVNVGETAFSVRLELLDASTLMFQTTRISPH